VYIQGRSSTAVADKDVGTECLPAECGRESRFLQESCNPLMNIPVGSFSDTILLSTGTNCKFVLNPQVPAVLQELGWHVLSSLVRVNHLQFDTQVPLCIGLELLEYLEQLTLVVHQIDHLKAASIIYEGSLVTIA
jgi:hypothetical protein